MQQLFCKSIETSEVEDEYGVPFHVFYGVPNNARKVIGYEPQDDSEVRFAEDIARAYYTGTQETGGNSNLRPWCIKPTERLVRFGESRRAGRLIAAASVALQRALKQTGSQSCADDIETIEWFAGPLDE